MKASILNAGGAWAFEEHSARLSRAMNLEISVAPADFNYLLGWEGALPTDLRNFIPLESILGLRINGEWRRFSLTTKLLRRKPFCSILKLKFNT